MASGGVKLGLFLAFVMMFYHGATAQSGCTSTLLTLSPCLNYVAGNPSTPSFTCCSRLATVIQNQPQCLCTFVNGGGSYLGISINQTRALGLPGTCGVQTPPVSRCNAGSGPATSPVSSPKSPADSSADTPTPSTSIPAGSVPATSPVSSPESPLADSSDDTPSTPTTSTLGSGYKTVPTSVDTSDAKNMRSQLHLILFLIFIASWVSYVMKF